ncbi:MAG: hypothetical protein ACI9KE_001890 [Polyangiales bacterium]|jgi:hypothetical protein
MSLVALGLAILVAFGLLVLDFVVMRRTEKRITDEDDAEEIQSAKPVGPARRLPGSLRLAAFVSSLFGWLNLPATLAPVILVALAMQVQPLGGDGTTALIGILVAAFSLSASVKAMRISDYLFAGEARYNPSLRQSTAYVLGWTVMVLCLLLVGNVPGGKVALVVYSYVGVLVAFAAFLFGIRRSAHEWLAAEGSVSVPEDAKPTEF